MVETRKLFCFGECSRQVQSECVECVSANVLSPFAQGLSSYLFARCFRAELEWTRAETEPTWNFLMAMTDRVGENTLDPTLCTQESSGESSIDVGRLYFLWYHHHLIKSTCVKEHPRVAWLQYSLSLTEVYSILLQWTDRDEPALHCTGKE